MGMQPKSRRKFLLAGAGAIGAGELAGQERPPEKKLTARAAAALRLRQSTALAQCVRPSDDGLRLIPDSSTALTIGGELNELAFNVPMGRNWAGKTEYDFSKSRKNPYANRLKRQVTIRLDSVAVDYFKEMAGELGMPYQNLINLFLRDCAMQKRRPAIHWQQSEPGAPR